MPQDNKKHMQLFVGRLRDGSDWREASPEAIFRVAMQDADKIR